MCLMWCTSLVTLGNAYDKFVNLKKNTIKNYYYYVKSNLCEGSGRSAVDRHDQFTTILSMDIHWKRSGVLPLVERRTLTVPAE